MLTKKEYQAPKVTKIKLVVKNAILGTCHASPNLTPANGGCGNIYTTSCFIGPGY